MGAEQAPHAPVFLRLECCPRATHQAWLAPRCFWLAPQPLPPPLPTALSADQVEVDPLSFGAPSIFSGASFRSAQTVVGGELPEPAVDPSEQPCLPQGRAGAAPSSRHIGPACLLAHATHRPAHEPSPCWPLRRLAAAADGCAVPGV